MLTSLARLDYPREDMEVILVDGGSTDATREIVAKYSNRLLIEKEKVSDGAARNLGIKHSRGDIIAFTDGDCVVSREWLSDLIRGFEDYNVGCVAGAIIPLGSRTLGQKFQCWLHMPNHGSDFRPRPYAITANVSYRREVFQKIGMFDATLPIGSDIDFCFRMQLSGGYALRFLGRSGIVFHQNQRSFLELLRRANDYGYGYYLLSRKYPQDLCDVPNRVRIRTQIIPLLGRALGEVEKSLRFAFGPDEFLTRTSFESMRVLWELAFDLGMIRGQKESVHAGPSLLHPINLIGRTVSVEQLLAKGSR